jgi:hypothetical protein
MPLDAISTGISRLIAIFRQQPGEAAQLDAAITANLRELGYAG